MTGAPDETRLLQDALADEHAAVYGYGVLGARLADPVRADALLARDAHRARRDALAGLLAARGASAPATLPAYDVTVAGPPDALLLAVRLEEGMAGRWRDLVAGTDDLALRRTAAAALTETAVRAARWRVAAGVRPVTVALPGDLRTD